MRNPSRIILVWALGTVLSVAIAGEALGCPAASCTDVQRQLNETINDTFASTKSLNYSFSAYNTWEARCGTVIDGQDIGITELASLSASSIAECAMNCEKSGRLCKAFTFRYTSSDGSGMCYQKSNAEPEHWKLLDPLTLNSSTPDLVDGKVEAGGGTEVTQETKCMEVVTVLKLPRTCVGDYRDVQCKDIPTRLSWYGNSDPNNWKVYCNIDLAGHDLGTTDTTASKTRTISECAKQCWNERDCQAFTFVYGRNETQDKDCFLKTTAAVTEFIMKEGAYWNLREQEVRCLQYVTAAKKSQPNMCLRDTVCVTGFVLSILSFAKITLDLLMTDFVFGCLAFMILSTATLFGCKLSRDAEKRAKQTLGKMRAAFGGLMVVGEGVRGAEVQGQDILNQSHTMWHQEAPGGAGDCDKAASGNDHVSVKVQE